VPIIYILGLLLAFMAGFVVRAVAKAGDREIRHTIDHLTVGEIMTPNPAMVPDTMTLDTLVGCVLQKVHGSTLPVVRDGHLVGLVTPDHLRHVAPGEWRLRTTADIATPGDEVKTARPDELLLAAFDRIGDDEKRLVVVDDADHVVGLVTPTDFARTVRRARRHDASLN
jgi:CBS-domain-containing membrane protein